MVVRMRHTRAHTRNRRSHHALPEARFSRCSHCKAPHMRHHACGHCGMYRGRNMVDTAKKLEKKAKKMREREKEETHRT